MQDSISRRAQDAFTPITRNLLRQAGIFLGAALVCVPISKKLGIGSVLGYLIAGILIGPYKLLPDIGHGGMGVVYKAEDMRLKRIVALKFLLPQFTLNTEAKERFIHEAQAASALSHHNICSIHDIDETNEGQIFMVMDCYEGETLKQKIERGPLNVEA